MFLSCMQKFDSLDFLLWLVDKSEHILKELMLNLKYIYYKSAEMRTFVNQKYVTLIYTRQWNAQ